MEPERPKGRVLVVEDDPLILLDVIRTLERAGFEVASAMRGLAAVREFESASAAGQAPDVVLMDVNLGHGMDGIEAATLIRGMNPEVAIVFRTAYSDTQTRQRTECVRPFAFLDKSAQRQDLLRTVQAAAE
ncbi:MAG TPA: response regulator [Acetobacteraceae bacterium]|nr:response regulator [Acetobacteraceae bacterium]